MYEEALPLRMHFRAQHGALSPWSGYYNAERRGAVMMIKWKERPLVRIRIPGKCAEASLNQECGLSTEEWYHLRKSVFGKLRRAKTIIPHELIDLVDRFERRTLVQVVSSGTSEGAGLQGGKQNLLMASEAMSFFLRMELRNLKSAEKKRKGAPVRASKLVPRSVIAEIAMDLLEGCVAADEGPGPFLIELFRELLNVGTDKHGEPRQFEAQEQAASIVAQYPTVPTRELARVVKVNPSTVSRWRRS